ncbi:MAG: ATP-dependent chaperone ClpB, partial [Gammaproteobacteria bacterium]
SDPAYYIGTDDCRSHTYAADRRPCQAVLFDEAEKAHPDVFNVLLQVLDDGRLTDGQGRTVDFRQTLIILTSNLGARALSELPDGADASAARAEVMEAVRQHFRPEFLNRLDEQIIFDRLNRGDMAGIVEIQLHRLEQRLAARKITLDLDATAKTWLADEGYDPVFGARPLKRVIQRQLQDPLAEMLLAGEILDGSVIRVTAGPEGLIIGDRVVQSRRERPQSAVVH